VTDAVVTGCLLNQVNVMSVLNLTTLFLPFMMKRDKGAIINVSSASALFPIPMMTMYSSSKESPLCLDDCLVYDDTLKYGTVLFGVCYSVVWCGTVMLCMMQLRSVTIQRCLVYNHIQYHLVEYTD